MDSTINCTRVPCSQATLQIGTPVELGLAPANLGPESDPVSNETNDEAVLNQSWQAASDAGHDERPTTTTLHENASNSSVGGIGFLLSSKACGNLISIESISPRYMVAQTDKAKVNE